MSVAIFGLVRSWAVEVKRPPAAEARMSTSRAIWVKRLDRLGRLYCERSQK
jgi:hypothetical protein